MDLNELKSEWANVGGAEKSQAELKAMTKASLPIRKIRIRLLIEGAGILFFLIVYYDWFDGHQKSWEVNAWLVAAILFNLMNIILGYLSLRIPQYSGSVKVALARYLSLVRRLSLLSTIASAGFLGSMLLFFLSVVDFTAQKRAIFLALLLILVAATYVTYRFWKARLASLEQASRALDS